MADKFFLGVISYNEEIASKYAETNGTEHTADDPDYFITNEFGWLDESGIFLRNLVEIPRLEDTDITSIHIVELYFNGPYEIPEADLDNDCRAILYAGFSKSEAREYIKNFRIKYKDLLKDFNPIEDTEESFVAKDDEMGIFTFGLHIRKVPLGGSL